MEYGKISKVISAPKTAVIAKMKTEIEQSKDFLEAIKKAKDKNFTCKVRPRITAQTKGIASYKGIFTSLEDAMRSGKHICIVPAHDGNVYEIRCNEMGLFITRAQNVSELSEIQAGFSSVLPPIPFDLLCDVIAFFRSCMDDERETEALVRVYWDKTDCEYRLDVPEQVVSKARVSAAIPAENAWDDDRFIYCADIHSHNSMPAKFSAIDDLDEKSNRIYVVLGQLDRYFPSISVRICNGGTFLEIDPETIFEDLPNWFPNEWSDRLHAESPAMRFDFESEKGAMAA